MRSLGHVKQWHPWGDPAVRRNICKILFFAVSLWYWFISIDWGIGAKYPGYFRYIVLSLLIFLKMDAKVRSVFIYHTSYPFCQGQVLLKFLKDGFLF